MRRFVDRMRGFGRSHQTQSAHAAISLLPANLVPDLTGRAGRTGRTGRTPGLTLHVLARRLSENLTVFFENFERPSCFATVMHHHASLIGTRPPRGARASVCLSSRFG